MEFILLVGGECFKSEESNSDDFLDIEVGASDTKSFVTICKFSDNESELLNGDEELQASCSSKTMGLFVEKLRFKDWVSNYQ